MTAEGLGAVGAASMLWSRPVGRSCWVGRVLGESFDPTLSVPSMVALSGVFFFFEGVVVEFLFLHEERGFSG